MREELEEFAEQFDADLLDENLEGEVEIPDDPGPAILGKTPVLGELRRQNDVPVARDKLKDKL